MTDFPPVVPCKGACAYKDECEPSWSDPHGCGWCCACVRACRMEYDVKQAYIPETPEQYKYRLIWEPAMTRRS